MIYTQQEMLDIWRRCMGFDIIRNDCTIDTFDGIDTDATLIELIRQWYLTLLDTADPRLLPVEDIASQLSPVEYSPEIICLELPDTCRRVTEVYSSDWIAPIAPADADDALIKMRFARMASPYARPGLGSPLAAVRSRNLILSPCSSDSILSVKAVVDPGENSYILDKTLLSTIPNYLLNNEPR